MPTIEIDALDVGTLPLADADLVHGKQSGFDKHFTVEQLRKEVSTVDNKFTASGTGDAIILTARGKTKTPSEHFDAYTASFKVVAANTGAVTVTIGTLPTRNIYADGVVLTTGYLQVGDIVVIEYDSVNARYNLVYHHGHLSGSRVLTEADEGAGNGIDADTLDGQQGAFYQDASNLNAGIIPDARLPDTITSSVTGNAGTATKLAALRNIALTGDVTGSTSFDGSANVSISAVLTAASVIAKLLTVDGAGSLLDADKLDGFEASYFLPAGSYTASDVLFKLLGVDGAGSGVDADYLDGQHGSFYTNGVNISAASTVARGTIELSTDVEAQALTDANIALSPSTLKGAFKGGNQSLASSGYQKLPGGLIIQWGVISSSASVAVNVVYPISFPTAFVSGGIEMERGGANSYVVRVTSPNASGFTGDKDLMTSIASPTVNHYWFAIGY